MNHALHPPSGRIADALPRRRFTVADVERMAEAGLLKEDDRLELIAGDLVEMSPKGSRHEWLKTRILRRWYKAAPEGVELVPETTFRLSSDTYLEPDITFFRSADGFDGLDGRTALLVVEIGHSSLGFDLGVKAKVYAAFGVRELWVIDAVTGVTHIHRDPGADGYGSIVRVASDGMLVPAFEGGGIFALRLDDLGVAFEDRG